MSRARPSGGYGDVSERLGFVCIGKRFQWDMCRDTGEGGGGGEQGAAGRDEEGESGRATGGTMGQHQKSGCGSRNASYENTEESGTHRAINLHQNARNRGSFRRNKEGLGAGYGVGQGSVWRLRSESGVVSVSSGDLAVGRLGTPRPDVSFRVPWTVRPQSPCTSITL